jgi:hypothetical protein
MNVVRQAMALGTLIVLAMPEKALTQQAEPDPVEPTTQDVASPRTTETASQRQTNPVARHVVPVADIVLFDFLLNRYGWYYVDPGTYEVTGSSLRHNLTSRWVLDNDPFATNQFLHPYQGAMYHGFARAAGLGYWQSFGYTFGGSLLWEIAGETTTPSKNDQIASGIGGSFLGEPLFRLANLVLEQSRGTPGFWRQFAAATISPATGFNRLAYGDQFKAVFPSGDPDFSSRLQLGVMGTASALKGITQSLTRTEAVADFSIDYGQPGNSAYVHRRPFDYFNLQYTASNANHFENIFSRGLLVGSDYGEEADSYKGVWGLYGSYDYVSPQLFRVSSTAFSLGNTSQRRLFTSGALESTVLVGVGYGAGGTINGAGERDYHYGLTPQALVAARLVAGNRAALDVTLRDYYISSVASTEHRGGENIARAEAQFGLRFFGRHGASVKYLWSRRAASYPDLGNRIQSRESFGLFYTYLGGLGFGAAGSR